MKTMCSKSAGICVAGFLLLLLTAASGHSHDTWIIMQNYAVAKSDFAKFTVANAHKFVVPANELLAQDQVEKVFFLAPDGKEMVSAMEGNDGFRTAAALNSQGSYLAVIKKKGGFSSKTPDGYQRGKNKKDVKDVIECGYSEKFAKAVFSVGKPGGDAYAKILGHPMEIIPMKDPAGLKKGDELPVKVLVMGKPARAVLFGTYAGFSPHSNTFAYTTSTDRNGVANIKLISDGVWLLVVKQNFAYPDATVCDKMSLAATLTFQVK